MAKKTRDYHSWRLQKLADPQIAANYLNAAISDSREMFQKALRNVAQARQVATIAKEAGIKRETLYRAFSNEGNPTLETLHSVLAALGLRIEIAAKNESTDLASKLKRKARPQKVSRQRKVG